MDETSELVDSPPPVGREPLPIKQTLILLVGAGVIVAAFVFLLVLAILPSGTPDDRAQAVYDKMLAEARTMVSEGTLARANGQAYAVDITQLATFAAAVGDRALYDPLRKVILEDLLIDDKDEDYTRGFIAWRYMKADSSGQPVPREASGSTEALRAAEALWLGSETFPDLAGDKDKAGLILAGYVRHQTTEHHHGEDIWFIRNYYNLQTRAWATNSFLIDYDPDFLARVARETGDAALASVARLSEELFKKAVAPTGLLREMVQPEVLTLMGIPHAIFAPNNLEQLSNSAAEAERSVQTNRPLAVGVLSFARARADDLRLNYNVETGEGQGGGVGAETYAPLVRLAVKLGDARAVDTFLPKLVDQCEKFMAEPNARDRLYLLGESLLALEYAKRLRGG